MGLEQNEAAGEAGRTHISIAQRPQLRIVIRQRLVLADTFGAVDLHSPVDDSECHCGYCELQDQPGSIDTVAVLDRFAKRTLERPISCNAAFAPCLSICLAAASTSSRD